MMLHMIRVAFYLILMLALPGIALAQGGGITSVRTGEHVGLTRVVVDLDHKPDWNLFALDEPDRIVVDIKDAEWRLEAKPDSARGLISTLRYGRFSHTTGRLVLELARPALAQRQFVLPPQAGQGWRLVIDLKPADKSAFLKARQAETPSARTTTRPKGTEVVRFGVGIPPLPPPRPAPQWTVVIDPGHGGQDPGALGRGKTREKDVVLAVGRAVRDAMRADGRFRVVMTRASDHFVPLRERVRIARRAKADLFISLHADAAAGRNVRGAGIYTLSENASDREAAALARRENRSDIIAGVDLSQNTDEVTNLILIDLVQRETMNESAVFAKVAVQEISKTIKLRGNPHRFAGFRVLRAPDVPSVLVELGFLSNAAEERKLKSRDWQKRVAKAITVAVGAYFER